MNTNENKTNEIITANSNYITRTFADTLVKFTRTALKVEDGKPAMFTESIATQFKGKMTVEQATENSTRQIKAASSLLRAATTSRNCGGCWLAIS